MSLLSLVEQAIKSCKAEQAKINDSILLYRELLQTRTPQPQAGSDENQCANEAATDTDSSPGEKEDMEMLERALEKALRVRTGTGCSKKTLSKQYSTTAVACKEGTQASASKGNQSTSRSASKSAASKEHKKPAGVVDHQAARKPQQAVSTPSNNTVRVSQTEEPGAHGSLLLNGKVSKQTVKWRSLKSKQNRLWDKVVSVQRKPEPGRSHFVDRMRATFPRDWPRGSPDQTRFLVDRLTHQGHGLTQHLQTTELLAKQTRESTTELGGKANSYDSCLRCPMTAAQLQNFANQAKREWEAWDRWRPEGGCLCPTGANGVWGNGMIAALPPTITYTTEAELRELETLRMRVSLLQQEIYLEQAILDTLSPQLSSIVPGPGCPSLSVLRHMYSLLGEGGERFPAIVLDCEPD
ncbi:tubulin epsilon and delta complex protein 2 isoform X2 [Anarrhichthys ocellatus]|uniref:tubulin epsilon and delta complex protein 2 isoform X2 n=1 Tax=Anarrhichthys ocellatus TaxID=433405 RepID=UPI0012ECE673|nr:tubulin epsilon and delta complex protein 2 isoform X2 [Anarrhichthys ocellatus]